MPPLIQKTNVMQFQSKNLVIARESRGVTQIELSKNIKGLSQGNLSRMEKGLLSITDDILISISIFLNYPKSFFYKEIISSNNDTLFFRKRNSLPQKSLSKLESRLNIINMVIDELMESVDVPEFKLPHIEVDCVNTIEKIAFLVRNFMQLPSGPINNIITNLEKCGIIILFINIDSEQFDGVTKFTSKSQPVICVNSNISDDRKRFTIAHELGHLVMHLRSNDSVFDENYCEQQANQFAAEFLMPIKYCKNELKGLRYKDLTDLKRYWKISKSAIIRRAKDIGEINDNTYRYYLMTLYKSGERKRESEIVSIDKPKILSEMIRLHIDQLDYNSLELSNLLGIPIEEVEILQNVNINNKFKVIIN